MGKRDGSQESTADNVNGAEDTLATVALQK